jgi:hypothetical protein
MHSVVLSEEAMDTDAETPAKDILMTTDVSCLNALLDVRDEIVAAGQTPSAEVPTPHDMGRLRSCRHINCRAPTAARIKRPKRNRNGLTA